MSVVNDNPRNIGVSGLQLVSGISELSDKITALFGVGAAVNVVPVETVLSRALFAL